MTFPELDQHLHQIFHLLKKQQELAGSLPILRTNQPEDVRERLDFTFPFAAENFSDVLSAFEQEILPSMNQNKDPRYGAYITGSGNPVSALAEFIKAFYNQNGLKWNNSPIAAELEQLVILWVAEFIGLPEFKEGLITSGGSMSNLMGIHFALADRNPKREMDGLVDGNKHMVYCSDQTHSSIDRAMVFLGLGRNQLRKIGVDDQFKIRIDQLREAIKSDLDIGRNPLMIIGNAGTTNTGSIDDLEALADLAQEFNLWYHVDGAYGLPARRLPELKSAFNGVDRADSVIINPHKWMYVTFEASIILLKTIPQAIHFSPDYLFTELPGLRWESSNHTIELSKEFRALKIWFTMKYYGADQLTKFVRQDIDMTHLLANELSKLPSIKIEPTHPLSILCFRWHNPAKSFEENESINIKAIRQIESHGQIFLTGTRLRGETYLRVYFGNPERKVEDVRKMANEICSVFQNL